MGILGGNQKNEPMHYGEVFGVWSHLMEAQAALVNHQVMINHTGDKELKKFLEDLNDNVVKPEIQQIEDLLKVNGIALPPAPPERPVANLEDIPVGARVMDPEIAAATAKHISAGLVSCSSIMGMATREDIGMMFGQFHMKKAQYGNMLLKLQKEKGWLILPPLHNPSH